MRRGCVFISHRLDLAEGIGPHVARSLVRMTEHQGLVARRLGHGAAQVEHRQRRYGAQAQHDAPDRIGRHSRSFQRQRHDRAESQSKPLHAEHQRGQRPALLGIGIFGHQHRAHRIVAADAEAQHHAENQQPDEAGGKRASQCADHHQQRLQAIDALAADEVSQAAEHEGAEKGRHQRNAAENGDVVAVQMPRRLDVDQRRTDDEQVVGIGEKTHARGERGAQMEKADWGVVQGIDDVGRGRGCAGCCLHGDLRFDASLIRLWLRLARSVASVSSCWRRWGKFHVTNP